MRRPLLALGLLAVCVPLAGLIGGPPDPLLGWSGSARGEFENWAWLDWWIPRYAACLWHHAPDGLAGVRALVGLPRDLDIGNALDSLLVTQPLKGMLGPIWGHDARVGVVLTLNAAAAFFACRQAVRVAAPEAERDGAALVCAVAIACNPVTLWDVAESRFAQALIAPALACIGCLLGWLASPRRATAVACGAWLAVTGLVYWFEAVFLAPLVVLALGCAPREWRAWGACLMTACVVALPFALPLTQDVRPHPPWGTPFPPLAELAIPPPGVLGPPGPGLVVAQSVDLAAPLAPPLGPSLPWAWPVIAGLAAAAAWRRRPGVAGLLAVGALGWWVFALGPWVRWHDQVVCGGPYALAYRFVPFVWRLSWPARTLPLAMTALGLLAAPGVAALLQRATRGRAALAVGGACLALLPAVLQGLAPLPVTALAIPAPYREAALGDPREGLVELTLPVNSGAAVWYQSWHGHPLLGGQAFCPPSMSDWPPSWARDPATVQNDPVLQWAERVRAGGPTPPWPTEAAARLRDAGFPWLVVQRVYGGRPIDGSARLVDALTRGLGPPAVDDPMMAAWRL